MATTVVENVMGAADFSLKRRAPDQHTSEFSQYRTEDKAYSESFSADRSPTNITKSGSPSCSFDFSSFSTQSRECTNKNGEQVNSFLEEHSLSLKSNYSSYDFEKILNDSSLQQKLKQEPGSQSSIDALLGGNFDSYKSKALDKPSENKWDFKTDYTSYVCEKNTTNSAYDKNKQKYEFSNSDKFSVSETLNQADRFSKTDLSSDSYKAKSQNFDFEQLMQTYSFETSKEIITKPERDLDASKKLHTKSSYDFEVSDVALRLRNSVQSDFLSNELWKGTPAKNEETKSQGSSAVRTIEEILKHHGISDNAPVKTSCPTDDTSNKGTNSSSAVGQKDLSQNNECSLSISKSTGSEPGQSFSSMQDKNPSNVYAISSNKDVNSSFRTGAVASSTILEPKSFTTQGTSSFIANASQNNETTSKTQSTIENDPLKRYGSSVDYTSTGKYGVSSGSTNYRMYDFGKSSSLSGDNTGSTMHFSSKDTKQFGGNSDKSKFDMPQVEGKSTFNASKASNIDIIKNLGSATDALEYSMSSERQRLRKLDTLISATPFNYSSMELPRSLRAQYMSPERTYSSLMSSDLPSRRIYSTSNMPSTSTHGAKYPTRNHMSGSVGQRDSSTGLNKSTSAPGSTGIRSVSSHGSSVDARVYLPFNSRKDYNMQYNNAYNPQLMEKLVRQKNDTGHQKKIPASKKKECPLKNAKEECSKRNDHMMYNQTPTGIQFLSNSQVKKPATAEKKKAPGKMESKKKIPEKDFNHSKNIGGLYDGFDFVKDLNRMWQETVFGPQKKPAQNQKAKYMPYKPASQEKKEAQSASGNSAKDIFSKDLWQPSIQRSDSSWAMNSAAVPRGKPETYGRDYGLQPVQKVRSQCSMMGHQSSCQTKSKGNNSMMKMKPNAPSAMVTKQQPATPKSILKQSTNKTNCMQPNANRLHSSLATSSKSCTQTAYQLPYHMIRGFSPVEPHSASRNSSVSLAKKQESSCKRLASRTSAVPKQGRRL